VSVAPRSEAKGQRERECE